MTRERRLGRGLEALLGNLGHPPEATAHQETSGSQNDATQLDIQLIDPNPFQPRRDFDEIELATLADSLREHGLLQPITVRRAGDRYQIVAGERRFRAASMADWTRVPVRVIDADDRQLVELAIVENLQRKDLNPLEKAASFQQYLQQYRCTQEELALRLQIDRSTVANLIRLLELPDSVQEALRSGAITQGHGRALLPLGDEREQVAMCQRIIAESMSVRGVESAVQEALNPGGEATLGIVTADGESQPAPRSRSEHLATLEQELRTALGMKVEIRQGAKGKGKLIVHFASHDEFERLHRQLGGPGVPLPQAG